MTEFDSLDRSIWLMEGEKRLYPKIYRDGAYRVFVGPKSNDVIKVRGRDALIENIVTLGRCARFALTSSESGSRWSLVNGKADGWDAQPHVATRIEAALTAAGRHAVRVTSRKVPSLAELLAKFQARVAALSGTERRTIASQRIGQDIYREAQILLWDGKCAVTGLSVEPLLRASHAKPWTKCTEPREKLDPFNGFLLAPHLDVLFDKGYISFDPGGAAIWSECLSPDDRERLGLAEALRLRWIDARHQPYLEHHRDVELRRRSPSTAGTKA